MAATDRLRAALLEGQVIPAHPLALTQSLRIDERHQRALTRYYVASGAGGMAVGVHTTGFPIHDPHIGLYEPVLELAALTATESLQRAAAPARSPSGTTTSRAASAHAAPPRDFVRVAGLVGSTDQAIAEAGIALKHGYHCGLLSLGAWREETASEILSHCRTVAEAIPLFGFYLQPAVGGRALDYGFWREFAEIPDVVAIKVAPFNRYATFDVLRAVADSGRTDIALYTGNDDNIVADLVTEIAADIVIRKGDVSARQHQRAPYFAGGLLGQWAVWTHAAVQLLASIHEWRREGASAVPREWLTYGANLTEANAAIFDVAHNFAGCLPGILEVLRGQGLVQNTLTLDDRERLSPGQAELIGAARTRFPFLTDDTFVAENLDHWLR